MKQLLLCLIMLLSAACSGTQNENLPTVAQLPTATFTVTQVAARPTLPPTWTPTATATVTPSLTITPTPTVTPSLTITPTPTYTPTQGPTVTPQPRAVVSLLELALQATVLPPNFFGNDAPPPPTLSGNISPTTAASIPTTSCTIFPAGGFGIIFAGDAALQALLGCPTGNPPVTTTISAAYQLFEHGTMLWLEGPPGMIYVLYEDGTLQRYPDTYDPNTDPVSSGQPPPPGKFEPVRGFGKVWRTYDIVRSQIGWGIVQEIGGTATVQAFANGYMVYMDVRGDTVILILPGGEDTGSWRSLPQRF